MEKESYIDDECVIKDETFFNFENFLFCEICKKILKNPMMCSNCQKVFCKACIDEKGDCPTIGCLGNISESKDKSAILKMIKFKCRNCKEEVKYDDVENHLKDGCKTQEYEPRLSDCINKKLKLIKLTSDKVGNLKSKGEKIYHLSGKKIFY
jgi:hypothetical protein